MAESGPAAKRQKTDTDAPPPAKLDVWSEERLGRFRRGILSITSTLETSKFVSAVKSSLRSLSGGDVVAASVIVYNEDQNELYELSEKGDEPRIKADESSLWAGIKSGEITRVRVDSLVGLSSLKAATELASAIPLSPPLNVTGEVGDCAPSLAMGSHASLPNAGVIGLLLVAHTAHTLHPDVAVFAEHVAPCLGNVLNHDMMRASASRLGIVVDASETLGGADTDTVTGAMLSRLRSMIKADRCSLWLLDSSTDELRLRRPLRSRDSICADDNGDDFASTAPSAVGSPRKPRDAVTSQGTITAASLHQRVRRKESIDTEEMSSGGIVGVVFRGGMTVNMPDVTKSPLYDPIVDGPAAAILCLPIGAPDGSIIGVVSLVNNSPARVFTDADEIVANDLLKIYGVVLRNSLMLDDQRAARKQSEVLLKVAESLFNNVGDTTSLLREIMKEARRLINVERCSIFLLDKPRKELYATVFDLTDYSYEDGSGNGSGKAPAGESGLGAVVSPVVADIMRTSSATGIVAIDEIRFPSNAGIAGHVVTTGKMELVPDVYLDPRFNREIDARTGFRTRNLLCIPIKDGDEVIGVAQLLNKRGGGLFTKSDMVLASAFAVYCGISVRSALMFAEVSKAESRTKVAIEMMSYHMRVKPGELERFIAMELPPINSFYEAKMLRFGLAPMTDDETVMMTLAMFHDLGVVQRFRIPTETLVKFVLTVKRGYRDVPYHNWMHAFSVAQFCYALEINCGMSTHLDHARVCALFVSCLCHDVDHRGTTNAFQKLAGSSLAALYSSEGSVMERHHFAHTVCILNAEGCNIFQGLSMNEYQSMLDIIKTNILATDLAHHFTIRPRLEQLTAGRYVKDDPDHRQLLCSLVMTTCDLSSISKPWDLSRQIADLIYTEFFAQGDIERARGSQPMEMMDRFRANKPKLQLGFIDSIALPAFRILAGVVPATKEAEQAVLDNRQRWTRVLEEQDAAAAAAAVAAADGGQASA